MLNRIRAIASIAGISCLLAVSSAAQAGLLVYEPFQYDTHKTLTGLTPNSNTIGLDRSVGYAFSQGDERLAGGLTFGSLAVAGGAELVTGYKDRYNPTYLAAELGSTANCSGTLYGSYLFKISSSGDGNLAALTVNDTNASDNNARFSAEADAKTAGNKPGVRYANSEVPSTVALAAAETYLVISKFTNVGSALSDSNVGYATLWTLKSDQFQGFLDNGRRETWLDANSLSTATVSQNSGTWYFRQGNFIRMTCTYYGGDQEAATFDEIRYGTSLADVTPAPEPGALVLLAIAAGSFAALAWRRRNRG
jgi:hypothetical protein